MKKRFFTAVFFASLFTLLVGMFPLTAQSTGYVPRDPFFEDDIKFGWSIGDIGASFRRGNIAEENPKNTLLFNAEVLKVFWLFSVGFSIGIDAFHAEYNGNERYMSFLPVEIAYTAFRFNSRVQPFLYTRYEWLFLPDGNKFVFTGGLKLVAYPIIEDAYVGYFNAFLEFGTNGDFRIGIGVDVVSLLFVLINHLQDRANGIPKESGDGLYHRPIEN